MHRNSSANANLLKVVAINILAIMLPRLKQLESNLHVIQKCVKALLPHKKGFSQLQAHLFCCKSEEVEFLEWQKVMSSAVVNPSLFLQNRPC